MKKAIYAGSFDPIHKGHKSIIQKSLKIFDSLLVVVANNELKDNSDINQRFLNVKEELKNLKNVEVVKLEKGFLVDLAKKEKINILVRSARNEKDFNYELTMAIKNKEINKKIETVLIVPNEKDIKIRSSLLKK